MTDTLSLETKQSAVAITAPGMQPSQHVSKVFFPISELFFPKNCSVARRFIDVADPLPPLQIVQSLTPLSRTAEFRAAIQPLAPVYSSAVMTDTLSLETEQSAVAKTAPGMQPCQHVSKVIRVLPDGRPYFWVLFSKELLSRSTFHKCWSSCLFPDCPIVDSSPMNGRVQSRDSTFGSCVQFSCNDGHTLFGDQTICCSDNGTWNATKPTCFKGNKNVARRFFPISEFFIRKNCSVARRFINVADPLPPLQIVQSLTPLSRTAEFRAAIQPLAPVYSSAVMTDTPSLETEQSAVAKTAPGMQPSQHVSVVIRVLLDVCPCFWVLFSRERFSRSTFNKCWSSCFFPDCPIVDSSPMNGRVHGSDSTFGSCVQFSCNDGHTLFGDRTICCSENGTWNTTKPTCFKGNKSVTRWSSLLLSSLVECNSVAWILDQCWHSSSFPDCPIVDSSLTNGRVQGSDSTFGSCVQFSCNDGHTLFGDRTICCSENGTWNATKPTCFSGN